MLCKEPPWDFPLSFRDNVLQEVFQAVLLGFRFVDIIKQSSHHLLPADFLLLQGMLTKDGIFAFSKRTSGFQAAPITEVWLEIRASAAFRRLFISVHLDLQHLKVLAAVQVLIHLTHWPAPPSVRAPSSYRNWHRGRSSIRHMVTSSVTPPGNSSSPCLRCSQPCGSSRNDTDDNLQACSRNSGCRSPIWSVLFSWGSSLSDGSIRTGRSPGNDKSVTEESLNDFSCDAYVSGRRSFANFSGWHADDWSGWQKSFLKLAGSANHN